MKRKKIEMTDKELREFLQKNRGNESLWSSKSIPVNIGKQGSIVFSLRFTANELKVVREQAASWGMTISSYVRKAALEWASKYRYDVFFGPSGAISYHTISLTSAGGEVDYVPEYPNQISTAQ